MYQWHLRERLAERKFERETRRRACADGKSLRAQDAIELALKLRTTGRQVRHQDPDARLGMGGQSRPYPLRARCGLVTLALRGVQNRRGGLIDLPDQVALCRAAGCECCAQCLFCGCFAIEANPSDLLRRRERAPLEGMRHSFDELATGYPALARALLLKGHAPIDERFQVRRTHRPSTLSRSAGPGCCSSPAAHRHRGRARPSARGQPAKTS